MTDLCLPYDPRGALEYFETRERYITGPAEVHSAIEMKQPVSLIDVRARADYEKGHIPGALSLPKEEWGTFAGLKREQANVIYCYTEVCQLAVHAATEFARAGFPVRIMEGGFRAWQDYSGQISEALPKSGAPDGGHPHESGLDVFTETRMQSRHSSSWPHS